MRIGLGESPRNRLTTTFAALVLVLPLAGGMVTLAAGGSSSPIELGAARDPAGWDEGDGARGGGGRRLSAFAADASPISFVTSDGISAGNVIESRKGGFRFPDGTIQRTASWNAGAGGGPAGSKAAGRPTVVRVDARRGGPAGIAEALAGIRETGPKDRFVISLGPGVYSGHFRMKPYVEIEGAGEHRTRLVARGAGDGTATVTGAKGAVLRNLSVESHGSGEYSVAVRSLGGAMRLESVRISAAGGSRANVGVINDSGALTLTRVTVEAEGGLEAVGVRNRGRASLSLRDVSIRVFGATRQSLGISDSGLEGAELRVQRSDITVAGAASFHTGIHSQRTPNVLIEDVEIEVEGAEAVNEGLFLGPAATPGAPEARIGELWVRAAGGEVSRGVSVESRSALIRASHLEARGARNDTGLWIQKGVAAGSVPTVRLLHSSVTAAGQTVWSEDPGASTRIGHSTLEGGPVLVEAGTVACAATVDEAFAFHAEGCPG